MNSFASFSLLALLRIFFIAVSKPPDIETAL